MPIGPTSGFLDFTNATPRANVIVALSNIGIGTDVPLHAFDLRGTANVADMIVNNDLTLTGGLTTNSLTINSMSMSTTSNFQQVTNVGNVTTNTVEFTNPTTGLAVTSNAEVGGELSVSGNVELSSNLTVSGNVGVGTTEPTETLDIVGNLNLQKVSNTASIKLNSNVVTEFVRSKKLIKYPRVAMTQNDESSTTGYVASASSVYANAVSAAWRAFDGVNDADSDSIHSWDSIANSYTSATPGVGQTSSFDGKTGEYINLKLPNKIRVISYQHWTRMDRDYEGPHKGFLYGSNDGFSTYTLLHQFDNINLPDVSMGVTYTHEVNSVEYYDEYRLLVTETQASTYLNISELAFYGIPEYDPEAHGTDVIVRSVPNVPNTDLLEVYYDGQDYTSMPSSVIDKTGNGHNGTIVGDGVGFDSTYKAFTFAGSDDYFHSTLDWSGDQVHSVSFWVKTTRNNVRQTPVLLGTAANSGWQNHFSAFELMAGGNIKWYFGNNDTEYYADWTTNTWIHLAFSYTGGGSTSHYKSVYMNGRKLNVKVEPTTSTAVSFNSGDTVIRVGGGYFDTIEDDFVGSIANLRIYEKALTSDEVWQLYAYQKEYFNVSPDVVTFKSGRLGIGTLEPKATLDIRGEVLINGYQLTSMYPGFASGGDDVYDIDGYRIHAFTNSGTFTVPGNDIYADVLVVGGGGGGGQDNAGGGGAGGLIFKPMHRFGGRRVSGTPDGFYIITIGSGGAGSPEQNAGPAPKSGGDTTIKRVRSAWGNNTSYSTESFSTAIIFIAKGGGPGQNGGNTRASSLNGGSGGGQDGEVNNGSAGGTASQPTQSGDSGTYGYGNNGGASNSEAGGGGGGAGEAGGNGSSVTSGIGGNGGDGLSGVGGYDFAEIYGTRYGEVVGEDVYFAGGGAGGNKNGITGSFASGGKGGGGNAGATPSTNENGLPGTGGGGAGAFWSSGYQYNIWGGNGGSGIVMIRYKL